MRPYILLAVAVVFVAGASYAQEVDAPQMPDKVRGLLDRLTGSWRNGDDTSWAEVEIAWDSGEGALIGGGQFQKGDVTGSWSELWHWDGISKDGIIAHWSTSSSHGISHGELRGKLLSRTVMEGQIAVVRYGKKVNAKVRIEFEGLDQFTWKKTDVMVGGEKQPDETDVYTRDGNSMTGNSTMTRGGETYLIKAIWKFRPNRAAFRSVWELSADNGNTWKPWKPWAKYKRERIGKRDTAPGTNNKRSPCR